MGYWMYDAKRKSASVSKKKTELIDLPETGFLSSIYIALSASNGNTSNEDNHLHDCLTKIEVVGAGGETIKSITGIQGQVLNYLDKESIPRHQMREDGQYSQTERWLLNFGRYFQDTEYMLDCNKVVDGQLKITWDLAAVRAVNDSTAFKDQNATLSVINMIPHEYAGPAPKGYIKSTETKQWTTGSSGIEYVKIPRDNPIRRILIRAFESSVGMDDNITNLKLNGNNGNIVPYDDTVGSLVSLNMMHYPPMENLIQVVKVKDRDRKGSHIGWIKTADLTTYGPYVPWMYAERYDNLEIGLWDLNAGVLEAVAQTVYMNCVGWAYHNSVVLPFDKPTWKEELLLQAQTFGSLELEVTQGNADAAASVVTEEVVTQS